MVPFFNSNCQLSLWFKPENQFFFESQNLLPVAFVYRGNIFAFNTLNWVGTLENNVFFDINGYTLLWGKEHGSLNQKLPSLQPLAPLKPLAPLTPLMPLIPLTPLGTPYPLGGWSTKDLSLLFK